MSVYRAKIKTYLQTITKSIKLVPEDKQSMIASRVNKVLQKYTNQENEQSLLKFQKQLQFNLNFIKLSYPNINFNTEQSKTGQQTILQTKIQGDQQQTQHEDINRQFELQNSDALKKQMKNISEVREQVQFTNWSEGNVDPENLKRHKQLLTRQHYGGDFWKGKEKPKMQSAQTLAGFLKNTTMQPPTMRQKDFQKKQKKFAQSPQSMFQKVKR